MNNFMKTGYALAMITAAALANADASIVDAKAQLSGTNLVVTVSLAGLPTTKVTTIRARATAKVTYVCVNRGSNVPSAKNKRHTFTKVVSVTRDIRTDDVRVTRQFTLTPPKASGFSCPPGQEAKLASVTYSDVRVVGVTHDMSRAVSGTFSKTLIRLGK